MKHLFTVSNKSNGAEKRLFKLVRLWLLYGYRAKNSSWTKRQRNTWTHHENKVLELIRACIRKNWPGYTQWWCQVLGSHKFIDLEANRHLEWLITLEKKENDG